MRIKIEATAGHKMGYRITLPNGGREQVYADRWDRNTARAVLNLLENVYGLKRRNIRFI